MMFLANNKFDFNKLFYESVTYMSLERHKDYQARTAERLRAKEAAPFEFDDPECIIFCNSKFDEIRDWLTVARKWQDGPKPELKLDLSFCAAKLFLSLIENLKHMFPNDVLTTEIKTDEVGNDFYLVIRLSSRDEADSAKAADSRKA